MRIPQLTMMAVLILGCSDAGHTRQAETTTMPETETGPAAAATSPAAGPPEAPAAPAESTMADYALIPLDRLFGTASLIVAGKVVEADDAKITIRVEQTLAGEPPSRELTVRPFTPSRFEGTSRPVPYAPGQSFLWFLDRSDQPPGWIILGIAGEGEMPIEEGFVYFQRPEVEGAPSQSYRVHGVARNSQRLPAPQLFDAVKDYRSCFEWVPGGPRSRPTRRCEEAALDRYAGGSPLHRHLVSLWRKRSGQ